MGAIATPSYAGWVALFPEMANISEPAYTAYFAQATLYHVNDGSGPVALETVQSALLGLMTAHIAWLQAPRDATGQPSSTGTQPASSLVGRISDASEGSVSVSAELAAVLPMTAAWFAQTKYGLSYWQATAAYRTMQYGAPYPRIFSPWPGQGWPGVYRP